MVRSSTRGSGNSPKDENWIAWMEEHGGLLPIDPDEEGLAWPAMSEWDGDANNEGNPWMIPPPHNSCRGKAYVRDGDGNYIIDKASKTRIMRPCWNWPMKGSTVCLYHGGGPERVRKKAMERLLSGVDAATGELLKVALNPDTEDKVKVQAINSILDRAGLRGGVDITVDAVPEWQKMLKDMFDGKQAQAED